MKKFNLLFLIMTLIISIFSISFATDVEDDTMYLYTNESGELIQSDEYEYEDAELIEDLEDYENIYNDSIAQETLKENFEAQRKEMAIKYPTDENNQKFIITDILSDIKTEYSTDYYYYYIIKYQIVKLRTSNNIEKTAVVILSYDVSDNKNIKPLKVGETVYGFIEDISSDNENYNIVQHGLTEPTISLVSISENDRNLGIVLLITLAILLLVLYTGKHGAKVLIPIFVAIDLLFIVLVPEIELGKNVLIISILIALELIILITVLKNGISRKTIIAILSSICVVILVTTLGLFFANTNAITGRGLIAEENYDMQTNLYYIDNVVKEKLDTTMLYISMIIILSSAVSATIASKLTELSEKYAGSKNITNNIIEEAKTIIAEYPMIISIIFLVMALPKYMTIVYNGVTFTQIINSEIIVTDLSLLLFTLISSIIIAPLHAVLSSLFMSDVEVKQIETKK